MTTGVTRHIILLFAVSCAVNIFQCAVFHNCDIPNLPVLMNFSFPDPMKVRVGSSFHLMANATVKETFPMKFKIRHKVERRFLGRWWRFPCIGAQGKNCLVDMPCSHFIRLGFNGSCPIQVGDYKNYNLTIPVPAFHVPWFLTEGLYRMSIEGWDSKLEKLYFCGNITQYIESADKYKKYAINTVS